MTDTRNTIVFTWYLICKELKNHITITDDKQNKSINTLVKFHIYNNDILFLSYIMSVTFLYKVIDIFYLT